eukprot:scaffold7962_cov139-Skeletonema_menzelii.AAC.3
MAHCAATDVLNPFPFVALSSYGQIINNNNNSAELRHVVVLLGFYGAPKQRRQPARPPHQCDDPRKSHSGEKVGSVIRQNLGHLGQLDHFPGQ